MAVLRQKSLNINNRVVEMKNNSYRTFAFLAIGILGIIAASIGFFSKRERDGATTSGTTTSLRYQKYSCDDTASFEATRLPRSGFTLLLPSGCTVKETESGTGGLVTNDGFTIDFGMLPVSNAEFAAGVGYDLQSLESWIAGTEEMGTPRRKAIEKILGIGITNVGMVLHIGTIKDSPRALIAKGGEASCWGMVSKEGTVLCNCIVMIKSESSIPLALKILCSISREPVVP